MKLPEREGRLFACKKPPQLSIKQLFLIYMNKPKQPNLLMKKALKYVEDNSLVLDIGCGSGIDSIYIANLGHDVTSIDKNKELIKDLKSQKIRNIVPICTNIEDFELDFNKYSMINAQWVLPFVKKEKFPRILKDINRSLTNKGIFCGQFFGRKDQWYFDLNVKNKINFITKKEFTEFLSDYFVVYQSELIYFADSISNKNKKWHVYEFIVSKSNVLQKNT
jgi:tellurite methyltransferase